jgi:hypothetical protein
MYAPKCGERAERWSDGCRGFIAEIQKFGDRYIRFETDTGDIIWLTSAEFQSRFYWIPSIGDRFMSPEGTLEEVVGVARDAVMVTTKWGGGRPKMMDIRLIVQQHYNAA